MNEEIPGDAEFEKYVEAANDYFGHDAEVESGLIYDCSWRDKDNECTVLASCDYGEITFTWRKDWSYYHSN